MCGIQVVLYMVSLCALWGLAASMRYYEGKEGANKGDPSQLMRLTVELLLLLLRLVLLSRWACDVSVVARRPH